MRVYRMTRWANGADDTVLGRLDVGDGSFHTVEDFRDMFPAGAYVCTRSWFVRGGYSTFEITGIEGRSRILFHVANWRTDVDGCVGIGLGVAPLGNRLAITRSREGFDIFMDELNDVDEFILLVEDKF